MAKHAKISDWSNAALQTVDKYFRDECRISQSSNCSHSIRKSDISGISVIIVFDTTYKCFVAFNGKIQSTLHQSNSINIRITLKNTYVYKNASKITSDDIFPLYVKRNANSNLPDGCYEKIVLFKEDALAEFCENYEDYLFPYEADEDYHSPAIFYGNSSIEFFEEAVFAEKAKYLTERQKDIVSRNRRSPDFRRKVLNYFNKTCVICGCKEQTILEAAHIQAVKDGGNDDVNNGICLCRNHHKLFDNGKLKIDFTKQCFSCSTDNNSAWYKEAEKRNFTLLINVNKDKI